MAFEIFEICTPTMFDFWRSFKTRLGCWDVGWCGFSPVSVETVDLDHGSLNDGDTENDSILEMVEAISVTG